MNLEINSLMADSGKNRFSRKACLSRSNRQNKACAKRKTQYFVFNEDTFAETSHGFRLDRSCHTALSQIKINFTGVKWFVEGNPGL